MYRVGLGSDQHRYVSGDGIILGGVSIPADFAVLAHSDGDVLLHAVTDALLGAVAGGDIGELFPDTLDENKNRASCEFLAEASRIIKEKEYRIVNVDAVIQAQKPKISAYKEAIAVKLAGYLDIGSSCVSIKAKTAEGMDAVGRCEGIRVDVVVMLRKDSADEHL